MQRESIGTDSRGNILLGKYRDMQLNFFKKFINKIISSQHSFINVYPSKLLITTLSRDLERVNILSLGSCRHATIFIFFKRNNYLVCEIKLILDTNIILQYCYYQLYSMHLFVTVRVY